MTLHPQAAALCEGVIIRLIGVWTSSHSITPAGSRSLSPSPRTSWSGPFQDARTFDGVTISGTKNAAEKVAASPNIAPIRSMYLARYAGF